MAIKVFLGQQVAVAQVDTVQITAFDAATTYILTIGSGTLTEVISVVGITDAATTATALKDAWEASTHPYAKYITATVATDTVTLTADTPGVPFTVVSSKTGGTGTIGAVTSSTANSSGSDFGDAVNWNGAALPSIGDTVIHDRNAPAMAWTLDQSALTGIAFEHPKGAGNVGLDRMSFAITADGQTGDDNALEYRDHYLQMDCVSVDIGSKGGPSAKASATRIKLDNTRSAASSATRIHSVDGVSIDPGKPTLRLLTNHLSADIDVVSASGGWGIAMDDDSETSVAGDIIVNDVTGGARSFLSDGVTWVSFIQHSGTSQIHNASAVASTAKFRGGTCEMLGSYTTAPTIVVNKGATLKWSASSAGISTLTIDGTFDCRNALIAPVINAFVPTAGAVIIAGTLGVVYSTGITEPDGLYTLSFS